MSEPSRILVVDDDQELAGTLRDYLSLHGYSPAVAGTAQAARRELARGRYELMLLDVLLGDGSGLDLARESRGRQQTAIIMLTGQGEEIDRVADRAEVSGIDDGVGAILNTLKKHGLDEDTIVVFAGDQGWMGGQNGFFGMGDHTRPFGAHDLMMQVPFIVRHPGAAGSFARMPRCEPLSSPNRRFTTHSSSSGVRLAAASSR